MIENALFLAYVDKLKYFLQDILNTGPEGMKHET